MDREEREAYRDAQKIQDGIQMAQMKIQAEAEEKKRTDEIQMAQLASDRARYQAKIGADNELTLQELELLAQTQVNTDATRSPTLHIR